MAAKRRPKQQLAPRRRHVFRPKPPSPSGEAAAVHPHSYTASLRRLFDALMGLRRAVGVVRVILMVYVRVLTNIIPIRHERDRQNLTSYAASFSAAFDPDKAIAHIARLTTAFQILSAAGTGPAITVDFPYDDYGISTR